jgi:hypothetical protein
MHMTRIAAALVVAIACIASAPSARAADTITCKLTFSTSGWSLFYKTAKGTGMVRCDNGQTQAVSISAKGGGLTVGKSKITDGFGEFANVHTISDVFGSYATGEAHAGAGSSAKAQVMTNGDVSLALAGKGEGWDLGVAFGKFTITPM